MALALLEADGLAVVDKKRLDALERLAQASVRWRNCMVDRAGYASDTTEALKRHLENGDSTWALSRAIDDVEGLPCPR
ncbi:hypothetical protein [Alicyclobacillus sp. ALC3]|uniref:hypothetical protein n=1 Tax=Alicyclobacillus sp. ALC3 TaxID=2796143 RepID=UPI002378A5A4|nr:hypothetical protein [Alicyclobacillus sp. ALC3]WDL99754.1 hypothetical protein JC200_23565 [Alicyclobacillus sp. ALC3]